MKRFYTAESVTEGHPDKLCDLIADSILDECLKGDSRSRVACEVLATKGNLLVAGEITSRHEPYVIEVVKKVLEDVGYGTEDINIDVQIHQQSPDIARAVEDSHGKRQWMSEEEAAPINGAGDQGVMIGYACNETAQMMPMPVVLVKSDTARLMLANSEFLILLNQASTDREELARLLNISDNQLSYITNVGAGHGLIRCSGNIVPFENMFPKNTKLFELMSTSAADFQGRGWKNTEAD